MAKKNEQASAKYADDMLFWVSGKHRPGIEKAIIKEIKDLKKDMKQWDIVINESKTNLLVVGADNDIGKKVTKDFKRRGVNLGDPKNLIKASDKIKYLGITINDKMGVSDAVGHAVSKGFSVYGQLMWILVKKETDVVVKRLIHKQLIRPTMTYGMSLWPSTTEETLWKVDACEQKILRGITGKYRRPNGKWYPNKELYAAMGLKDTIVEQINKTKEKYEARKEVHPNEWFRNRINDIGGGQN